MPAYTFLSDVNNHPLGTILLQFSEMTKRGGVWDIANDLVGSERAAGANLTVDVSKGTVLLKRGDFCYPVWTDAITNVTIDSNSSGNSRISSVICYVDLTNSPAVDQKTSDRVKFLAVNGTASASPVAPDSATIEAAIGASDPYEVLFDVLVEDGETAIQDADITDRRRKAYIAFPRYIEEVTYSATVTPDYDDGSEQHIELTGDITINNPTNMEVGDWIIIKTTQDATGGRDITWASGITWLTADISQNTTANKVTNYAIQKTGSSTFEGYLIGKQY